MRAINGVLFLPLLAAVTMQGFGQQQESAQAPSPSGSQTAAQPSSTSAPTTTQPPAQTKPKAEMPYFMPDGGFSIEPFYWLSRQLPVMRGGAQAIAPNADFNYVGHADDPFGMALGIPAGAQSTIRVSYFRIHGRGNENLPADAVLLGTQFYQGDYMVTNYIVQDAKVSWDYLTWPVTAGAHKVRFKTLWEVQWLSFDTHINAPFAPPNTTSNSGNFPSTTKNLILPTLGGELTQAPSRHFRWELKGDGFAIPHHAVIWEGEASLAFRVGRVELLAGGKAFHYKTSPKADQYFLDTLWGPYAGLRYYLTKNQ